MTSAITNSVSSRRSAQYPHRTTVYDDYTDSIVHTENGAYSVPDGPGLGVEYDWDYIRSDAVRTTTHGE